MSALYRLDSPIGVHSIESLVKGYLLSHRTQGSSPHTVKYYSGILTRFLWFASRVGWPLDARLIDEWHIREFLGYVGLEPKRWERSGNGSESSSHKASPRTIHHYYRALHAFFGWAVREGFLESNPVAKVRISKPKPRVIRPYSSDQIRRMLQVCEYDWNHGAKFLAARNRAIVIMLLDTGLRLSELASIRMSDIDVDRGWIKVCGKGQKERIVRIGRVAQKALWRYLMCRPVTGEQSLWLTEEKRPMSAAGIQSMIDRLKQRAGINEQGCVHRFRHTFALAFLREDGNPFNLQYLLGHSSLEMVRRYTAALGMEDALKAHEKASPADKLDLRIK